MLYHFKLDKFIRNARELKTISVCLFFISIKMIILTSLKKVQCFEARENNVHFFVAINWCTSRRVMLLPASCARYLRVFRADPKQPPERNDPEEGRGQSQVSPVRIKRKKRDS